MVRIRSDIPIASNDSAIPSDRSSRWKLRETPKKRVIENISSFRDVLSTPTPYIKALHSPKINQKDIKPMKPVNDHVNRQGKTLRSQLGNFGSKLSQSINQHDKASRSSRVFASNSKEKNANSRIVVVNRMAPAKSQKELVPNKRRKISSDQMRKIASANNASLNNKSVISKEKDKAISKEPSIKQQKGKTLAKKGIVQVKSSKGKAISVKGKGNIGVISKLNERRKEKTADKNAPGKLPPKGKAASIGKGKAMDPPSKKQKIEIVVSRKALARKVAKKILKSKELTKEALTKHKAATLPAKQYWKKSKTMKWEGKRIGNEL